MRLIVGFRTVIKSNKTLRRLGKSFYVYEQYWQDAHDFSKYYVEQAEAKGDYRYSIMLLVHSLEKGMCMPDPRPFGIDKVRALMAMLDTYSDDRKCEFEYELGISALYAWLRYFKEHCWENEKVFSEVKVFLNKKDKNPIITAGAKKYKPYISPESYKVYEELFLNRHSVRNFQNRKIEREDLEFALKCFVETPTACNRQMCRVYYISNPDITDLLNNVVIGIPGFNKKTVQYFVITYDLASFAYSGERQQGLFNAGLCTMNFINGLHAKGIGSCCLQWSNKYDQDQEVRSKIGLSESERIGIVIGAGYYLEENTIPCSVRRNIDSIFTIV